MIETLVKLAETFIPEDRKFIYVPLTKLDFKKELDMKEVSTILEASIEILNYSVFENSENSEEQQILLELCTQLCLCAEKYLFHPQFQRYLNKIRQDSQEVFLTSYVLLAKHLKGRKKEKESLWNVLIYIYPENIAYEIDDIVKNIKFFKKYLSFLRKKNEKVLEEKFLQSLDIYDCLIPEDLF